MNNEIKFVYKYLCKAKYHNNFVILLQAIALNGDAYGWEAGYTDFIIRFSKGPILDGYKDCVKMNLWDVVK